MHLLIDNYYSSNKISEQTSKRMAILVSNFKTLPEYHLINKIIENNINYELDNASGLDLEKSALLFNQLAGMRKIITDLNDIIKDNETLTEQINEEEESKKQEEKDDKDYFKDNLNSSNAIV